MTDALAALRAYAYTRGLRLTEVAADVLARKVRLTPREPIPSQGDDPDISDNQEE